jgi:NAD-dependent deacetylase sirtuin 5
MSSSNLEANSESPANDGSSLSRDFKDELRKQFFARDQREKPSLNKLVPLPSTSLTPRTANLASPTSFVTHLQSSNRILCLVGAGLSVSSGIPTFRDANGKERFWRDYQVSVLSAAPHFKEDPVLSWWYYASRRGDALRANPNSGHQALAELSKIKKDMLIVSQNIDGLLERTNLAEDQLVRLHGSVFSLRCSNDACTYKDPSNYDNPLVPALAIPSNVDISSPDSLLPQITKEDLPQCPTCNNLLRPGILWFGEELPKEVLGKVDEFLEGEGGATEDEKKVDLMIDVGTSAMVWPAADFVHKARKNGAKIAVFDVNEPIGSNVLMDGDWFFKGDAAVMLPDMVKSQVDCQ